MQRVALLRLRYLLGRERDARRRFPKRATKETGECQRSWRERSIRLRPSERSAEEDSLPAFPRADPDNHREARGDEGGNYAAVRASQYFSNARVRSVAISSEERPSI